MEGVTFASATGPFSVYLGRCRIVWLLVGQERASVVLLMRSIRTIVANGICSGLVRQGKDEIFPEHIQGYKVQKSQRGPVPWGVDSGSCSRLFVRSLALSS